MEGVAVENLIDFDIPSCSDDTAPSFASPPSGALLHTDIFSSEPLFQEPASIVLLEPRLPDPLAPMPSSHHHCGGEDRDSDATESADSENDMDPHSQQWNSRHSSSSSNHSAELGIEAVENQEFMKAYVEMVFHGKEDFDQEEKARFGELCSGENGKGREWFARYVSAQRCNSKCVSEATFYRLVQSFAVVLFECYQMDDYSPAKNLMTMCFTYYHTGKSQPSPTELLQQPPVAMDSYLNKANSWLSGKKDAAGRLLKNSSAAKTEVKGFFGGLESKLRASARKNEEAESPVEVKPKSPEKKKVENEKVYLYTHLKQQPIWHTLRFWNAAFFDAVHCERKKRSPTTRGTDEEEKDEREKWCHMTQEEKDDSSKVDENIAFGQLGTFTHNMLAFGLSKKLCNDFLKKQAVIGNLNEEQYKLLSDHIEQMATDDSKHEAA
uniref:KIAA0513 n=1 Tax=Oncorhynchus mykiss TaxID=8022 RepID=A0A8C7TCB7_ONCMY